MISLHSYRLPSLYAQYSSFCIIWRLWTVYWLKLQMVLYFTRSLYHRITISSPHHHKSPTSELLQNTINLILILQFQRFGRLIIGNPLSIQQESKGLLFDPFPRCIGPEYFDHFGAFFNFEDCFLSRLFECVFVFW